MKKYHRFNPCPRDTFLDDRALRLGAFIAEHHATVRSTAAAFGISKSTVHKDVTVRLPRLQPDLYAAVRSIIEKNKQERHLRGGLATKEKYLRERSRRNLLPRPYREDCDNLETICKNRPLPP